MRPIEPHAPAALVEPLHSEACERNKGPIGAALGTRVPGGARVWEIGCGTGQHAEYLSAVLSEAGRCAEWIPSDRPGELQSIALRRAQRPALPIAPARAFDLADSGPPVVDVDWVFCANVLHIAPWSLGQRIFDHAQRALRRGGALSIYGPFLFDDRPLAPSNAEFDRWLRARDPASGLRALPALQRCAADAGFGPAEVVDMPANNHLVIFTLGD